MAEELNKLSSRIALIEKAIEGIEKLLEEQRRQDKRVDSIEAKIEYELKEKNKISAELKELETEAETMQKDINFAKGAVKALTVGLGLFFSVAMSIFFNYTSKIETLEKNCIETKMFRQSTNKKLDSIIKKIDK